MPFDPQSVPRWASNGCPALWSVEGRVVPVITAKQATPLIPGIDLWDMWPLELLDGELAVVDGRSLWFILYAPALSDPVDRHLHARIRLMSLTNNGVWYDHGPALPEGLNPGEREWSGSAVLEDRGRVTLYFTAAGLRETPGGFQQRLFLTHGQLTGEGKDFRIENWVTPQEFVRSDGAIYDPVVRHEGRAGTVKAFRDPAYFRDPSDGKTYVTFAASAGWSDDPYNGVVGLARREAGGHWALLPPILSAVGVNNELERPHIRWRDGTYYLFWSTQRHTFAQDVRAGPSGLYAMAAPSLAGPWVAVNGDSLVACNPPAEPRQSYSWIVTSEWKAYSFIDYWGLKGRVPETEPALVRAQFGGTPAPPLRLEPDGNSIRLCV